MISTPMTSGLQSLDPSISKAAQTIQGMPPQQALLYLAQHGVPLSTAVAIMQNTTLKQHAALVNPQGQKGPQSTVKDQLNQATMQAVQTLAADNARRGGISQLPVPESMFSGASNDPHQGMAGGGIVAFADGGFNTPGAPTVGGLTAADYFSQQPQGLNFPSGVQQFTPPPAPAKPVTPGSTAGAPLPTDQSSIVRASVSGRGPTMGMDRAEALAQKQKEEADANAAQFRPQSVSQHFDNLWGIAQSQGIGEASKTHLAELDNMKDQFGKLKSQNNWLALSQAGFAMAQAATQNPHGGFLGALAVGGAKGAEQFGANLKDYRDAMAKVNEQRYLMEQQQENVKAGFITMAATDHDKDETRYENLVSRQFAAQDRVIATIAGKEIAADTARANIMAAKAGAGYKGSGADMLMRDYLERNPNASQADKEAALGRIQQQTAAAQGASARAGVALTAVQQKTLNANPEYTMGQSLVASGDPALVAQGNQLVQRAIQEASQIGAAPLTPGSGAQLSPQVQALMNQYAPVDSGRD